MPSKDLAIHRTIHGEAGAQQSGFFPAVPACVGSDHLADVQPGDRGGANEVVPREMTRIIGANREVRSRARHHLCRFQHQLTDPPVVAGVQCRHPLSHRNRMHGNGRMVVVAEISFGDLCDRAVAECGAFSAAGDNTNVFHSPEYERAFWDPASKAPAASPG